MVGVAGSPLVNQIPLGLHAPFREVMETIVVPELPGCVGKLRSEASSGNLHDDSGLANSNAEKSGDTDDRLMSVHANSDLAAASKRQACVSKTLLDKKKLLNSACRAYDFLARS